MEPLSVVLYQKDPGTAQTLAVGLSQHFELVYLAGTYEEVRPALPAIAPRRWCSIWKPLDRAKSSICIASSRLCIVGTTGWRTTNYGRGHEPGRVRHLRAAQGPSGAFVAEQTRAPCGG